MIEDIVNKKFEGNKRLKHVYGVAEMAKKISEFYNFDTEKAYIAGLLHDFCKYDDISYMESLIDENDLKLLDNRHEIYHAYASSVYANKYLNITDLDILNAIKYHVFGRINMSNLEKVIVISDFCEVNRTFKEAEIIRDLVFKDFDLALIKVLEYCINFLKEKGVEPLKIQIDVLNYYMEEYYGAFKKDC